MTTLFLDLETFCTVPINHGTHAYAAQAEIMLFAYAIDKQPAKVWDVTCTPAPQELLNALKTAQRIVAHNSHFDRTVLRHTMPKFCPPVEKWFDTMVQAYSHSLKGGLSDLCDIFKVSAEHTKDKDGRKLIHLFCKPQPKNRKVARATSQTHPTQWAKFIEYARLDVEAMRALYHKMPTWNYRNEELALWHLDQRINDRGVAIDTQLVAGALTTLAHEKKQLDKQTQAQTQGEVQAATQRDALLKHILEAHGVSLPNLQKSTLERRLHDENLPQAVRNLIALRLQSATTSTSKFKALTKSMSQDGRLRGCLQFNGAMRTGRWAGRVFQPQNLPRPTHKQHEIDTAIDAIKNNVLEITTDNVMAMVSSTLRGCLTAPASKKLVVSDLSNIEGRVQAWLAGENWKLKAFKAFDAGTGHDLYKLAYAKSFNVTPQSVKKDQRQIGKVQELALGYGGGVSAFLSMAANYGMDLKSMAKEAYDHIPPRIMNEASRSLAWHKLQDRSTHGLTNEVWQVCDSFKRMWREAHPQIATLWQTLETTVKKAIIHKGKLYRINKHLSVLYQGAWLRIRLPSGRFLCYPAANWNSKKGIYYKGVNSYTKKWENITTYGGKLFENICQAVARDVLAHNMQMIENAGYEIVLTVHDEVICEALDTDEFNETELSSLLATNPKWAEELPLAAGGFEAYRYRKD